MARPTEFNTETAGGQVMMTKRISQLIAVVLMAACSEGAETPTAAPDGMSGMAMQPAMDHMSNATTAVAATTFTVRATLEPYQINQQPDFMIQSKKRSDIVMQQSVFAVGAGMWHTHPGPSFIYVVDGNIKLEKVTKERGCIETPVYGPGDAYFEVGEQVHRAVVTSSTPATVLVTRFNVPPGQPFTIPAADPNC
jgi:quercetin dioxygenase-like cupin family protein